MQTRHGDSQGTEQSTCVREMNGGKEKVKCLIVIVTCVYNDLIISLMLLKHS